ncbi:glycosyltransferase family 4 protein [Bacillus sp. PAMC26568]|nr:glycosyltransferase family 4 protein [Bacillus sp. PAMC26568]
MGILINGRFLTQKITGVQRFAYEILNELNQNLRVIKELNIKIITPNYYDERNYPFKNIPLEKKGSMKSHIWEQSILHNFSEDELLINLCNTAPIFRKNQINVIHDVAIHANPDTFSVAFRLWYKIMFWGMAKFSKRIITVSNFSKSEIIKYLSVPEERVNVMPEGKEQILRIKSDCSILERHDLKSDSYLLAVSSLNPNKNFRAIIEAIKYLPKNIKVVIAGGSNSKVFQQDFNETDVEAVFVGYVSDEELKALYENAYCFIYPSFYEGFGLPPLEAMTCGCPVISSNTTSLPEVGGDAVLYVDPHQPKQIAEHVNRMLFDQSFRDEMIEKGYKQATKYTWKKALKELLSNIEEVNK